MFQTKRAVTVAAFGVLMAMSVLAAYGAEPQPAAKTCAVVKEPLKTEITVDGVFESELMTPVSRVPKAWTQMKVLWAAEAGTVVKQGDPLVKLDPEDLDKRLADTKAVQALQDIAWKQAQEELRLLKITTARDVDNVRLSAKRAEQDFEYWLKNEYAYKMKYFEMDKEGSNIWFDTVKMELSELKRMYEADDLIETTEKLVLRRQEHGVKRATMDYERQMKFHYPRRAEVNIPRELEDHKLGLRNSKIELDRAETMLSLALERKELEVEKMKYDRAKSAESVRDLEADRETMIITAPVDGVVYYGECVRGQWPTGPGVAGKLKEGGQLGPGEVFMTIVKNDGLFVRAGVAENHLQDLARGLVVSVIPTAYPVEKLAGKVDSLTIIPSTPAPYVITVALEAQNEKVLSGMTCKVTVTTYENKDALTVPAGAVFTEPLDEDASYVHMLPAADAEAVKHPVTVGRKSGDKVEILEGLKEGDTILLEEPGK